MHHYEVKSGEWIALLVKLLHDFVKKNEQVIVFTNTKYEVDLIENLFVNVFHISGSYLYGRMDTEQRAYHMENFTSKKTKVLVVTDLCARGIDIPDVEVVINYEFPLNIKTFIHRCGRTARAGKSGTVYSLFSPEERPYVFELDNKMSLKSL